MNRQFQRLLMPFFYCLAVACLVEIPLAQTELFGENVILWDTMFRTILAMPGLWCFSREDQMLRTEVTWNLTIMVKLAAVGAIASIIFRILLVSNYEYNFILC